MFIRHLKKQSRFKRFLLKILNIYAFEKETFKLINPLSKNISSNYYKLNDKTFILSSGYLDLKRKIKKIDIYFRYAPNNQLWNSSKRWKRIIQNINKEDLILTTLNSLKNSILFFLENNKIDITINLISDASNPKFDLLVKKLLNNRNFNINFFETKKSGNRGSFLECCDQAKNAEDIIFFIEDDYLFEKKCIDEMVFAYSRISTMLDNDIFLCPSDYPFYYDANYHTSLFIGKNYRWRTVFETLLTFMFSKKILDKYENNIRLIGEQENHPFEKPLHSVYLEQPCLSPVGTLSHHISKSVPSVNEDWLKTWNVNFIKSEN